MQKADYEAGRHVFNYTGKHAGTRFDDRTTNRIAIAVILIGAALRLVLLGVVPGNAAINQDEALAGYEAYSLLNYGYDSRGYNNPVYLVAWGSGMNALESYFMMPFIAALGLTPLAIRLPQALLGIATIVAVFLFARRSHGNDFAIVAVLLLSINPWHIMMSRWALESNLLPGMLTLATLFLTLSEKRRPLILIAALCFGLALYCYAAAWVVMPVVVGGQLWFMARSGRLSCNRWAISAGVAFLLLAIPLVLFVLVNVGLMPEVRTPFCSIPRLPYFRKDEVSFTPNALWQNLTTFLRVLLLQTDGHPWNAMPLFGLYYPFGTILGVIGSLYALRNTLKATRDLDALLLIQLGAAFVLGLLVNVNVNRCNIVHIPLIYFQALAIYRIFLPMRPRLRRVGAYMALSAYSVAFITFELAYFGVYNSAMYDVMFGGSGTALASDEVEEAKEVYVGDLPYSILLFHLRYPTDALVREVTYEDLSKKFQTPRKIGKFRFKGYDDEPISKDNAYLCTKDDDAYISFMSEHEMSISTYGIFVVGTPSSRSDGAVDVGESFFASKSPSPPNALSAYPR